MNVVILTGNLARDPDTRYTPKGTAIIEATLCVSEKWTDDAGQQREKTIFAGLVFYGARGEAFPPVPGFRTVLRAIFHPGAGGAFCFTR